MHVTVDDLVRIGATILEESESTLADALIDSGDSFAIETKATGEWLIDTSRVPAKPGDVSTQPPPVINAPQPLFGSGPDFFSGIQQRNTATSVASSSTAVVPSQTTLKPSALIKPAVTKDSRQLKINKPLPGTLGLGNM